MMLPIPVKIDAFIPVTQPGWILHASPAKSPKICWEGYLLWWYSAGFQLALAKVTV